MMTGTLITEDNADFFMPAVGTNALVNSDVFIGVVDEETDTACGVLSAEAVGDRTLAIRWIYVDESRRKKGAGRELINTLRKWLQRLRQSLLCAPEASLWVRMM